MELDQLINFVVERFDHVERIYKSRILTQKHGGRMYNYIEYLIHCPPGEYDGILVFKSGNDIQTLSTHITVYSRGTARYFSFTLPKTEKQLVYVFLKNTNKK